MEDSINDNTSRYIMTHPSPPPKEYRILALYRFVPLTDSLTLTMASNSSSATTTTTQQQLPPEQNPTLRALQSELVTTLRSYNVKGTLLIAPEGINGTICYPYPVPADTSSTTTKDGGASNNEQGGASNNNDDDPVYNYLKSHPKFGGAELRTRLSVWGNGDDSINEPQQAFARLKIKIKSEIVTLGLGRPLVDRKPVSLEEQQQLEMNGSEQLKGSSSTANDDGARRNDTIANNNENEQASNNASPSTEHQQQYNIRQSYNQLSNPLVTRGTYLNPKQWDTICHNPNILVIDTRNTYEIELGTFKSAIDPKTQNFSDFPNYLQELADEFDWNKGEEGGSSSDSNDDAVDDGDGNDKNKKIERQAKKELTSALATKKKPPPEGIAMFCTGGIRCEKATSYAMQSDLFPSDLPIYHLDGGILAYLDDVAKRGEQADEKDDTNDMDTSSSSLSKKESSTSTFHGECFVFDKRVAVTEGLKPSTNYIQCHGCRGPMDHRLLSTEETNVGDNSNCVVSNCENSEEVKKYKELSMGITNLPPLRYDNKTQRHYLPGLTCPRCHSLTTRESLERFVERERQVEICKMEGRSLFSEKTEDK